MKKNILSIAALLITFAGFSQTTVIDSGSYNSNNRNGTNINNNGTTPVYNGSIPNNNTNTGVNGTSGTNGSNATNGSAIYGTGTNNNNVINSTGTSGNTNKSTTKTDAKVESYYLKNGKLVQYVDGQLNTISKTITFKNGASVTPAGFVKSKDGKSTQLKNGDAVDLNGNITKFKPQIKINFIK